MRANQFSFVFLRIFLFLKSFSTMVVTMAIIIHTFSISVGASEDREALRHLPIQDSQEGRVKPF